MQKTVHGDFPVVSQECMKISGGGECVCVCVVGLLVSCAYAECNSSPTPLPAANLRYEGR